MNRLPARLPARALVLLLIAGACAAPGPGAHTPAAVPPPPSPAATDFRSPQLLPTSSGNAAAADVTGAAATSATEVVTTERAGSRLAPELAELAAAYAAGDRERLAALAGSPHVDLAAGTARVILEMDRDPEARPGTPTVEVATAEGGQRIEIYHAPPVAIRAGLAQAIAATGATYETAYDNLVQVLAPFGSLLALAAIPDVRLVRLPWPAGP